MNSAADVWSKTLSMLKNDLTEITISTFFNDCTAIKLSNDCLILHTPSSFKKEMIENRYIGLIKDTLQEIFSGEFEVVIVNDEELEVIEESLSTPNYLGIDEYTFEHFVVGDSNKFAHAAALAVSKEKKQNYNPLFIYGESGLGKTHLLYAVSNSVEKSFPHYKIVYVTGEVFTNEMVEAIQFGKFIEFREKYRNADYFLMDDIHSLSGRPRIQEEFFNTFNTLYEIGTQIILTSDRPPREITALTDRIYTRLEASLITEIEPPDDVLRIAIIKNKARQLGVMLPDDITKIIAENMTANVRQLEGAVKMIVAYRDIMNDDITVDTVKERINEMFKGTKVFLPTVDTIIEETANLYSLTPEDLKGPSKVRDIALARNVAIYLIRKLTNFSLKNIGNVFGGRDHSTILHSLRRIEEKIKESQEFSGVIKNITSNIHSKTQFYSEHSTYQQ